MNYSCEAFMNFCDEMMIEDIAEEGLGRSYLVTIKEQFRSIGVANKRLLNHLKKFRAIAIPKKLIPAYNKFMNESDKPLKGFSSDDNGEKMLKTLNNAYQKLSNSKEYKMIMSFDASDLSANDFEKLDSSLIIKTMNHDLKFMQENRMVANIKEANDDRGVVGRGVGNASGFKNLQNIYMMRYKVNEKICSFKMPKR